MTTKIRKINLKKGSIDIFLSAQFDESAIYLLKDIESDNKLIGTIVDDHIEFSLTSAGSSLGHYELQAEIEEEVYTLDAEDTFFQNVKLEDYCYDDERDVYLQYLKNEEGRLNIVINKIRDIPGKEKLQVNSVKSGVSFIELGISKDVIEAADDYHFVVVPNKREGMWSLPITYDEKTEILKVDFSSFVKEVELQGHIKKKWRMYFGTVKDGYYNVYIIAGENLRLPDKTGETDFRDDRDSFLEGLYSYMMEDKYLTIYPYLTKKNNIALMQFNEVHKYTLQVRNRVTAIHYDSHGVFLDMEVHDLEGHDVSTMLFRFRTKTEEEIEILECPITIKSRNGSKLIAQSYIDFNKVNIRPLYWDVRVIYAKDGIGYETYLYNDSVAFDKKYFKSLSAKATRTLKSGEIFYPYRTTGRFIAFQCRPKGAYDNLAFRLKERLAAFIYFILKPFWINKNIYLVYEKFCVMAQDNGYYFFKYCMENDVEKKLNRRIYYVMDPKSPDWDKVSMYKDRVIPFMSLKHMVYLIASKLLISTDTIDHAYAWRPKDSILHQYLDSKKLVFLQHGVIALKQVHFLYSRDQRGRCNIFVTSNNMERDIIYDYFGYKMDQIAVTGLCRWDVLEDKSAGLREILIMPTWRNWLDEVSDEMFKESDYYKHYMGFLNSNKLKEYLEQYDLKLNFYLHPKFREYIGNFSIDGERLRLIPFGEEPLNELMMRCKLLVTDYSSVCWDVFYQGKPVIFFQFDADHYEEAHGSYINFEKDLFGDRVQEPEELLNLLEEYAKNEFALKDKYAKMRKNCYKYIDKNNSKRICDEIVKRGW